MSNSTLFKQAHKMTKMEISMSQRNVALTIQPNETYRYKFGQWLIFLKTGITNMIKPQDKKVNQSVCYVPILQHDRIDKFSYKLALPLTLTRNKGSYSESYYLGKMLVLLTVLSLFAYLIF